MKFKSNVDWGDYDLCNGYANHNITTDVHGSKETAFAICKMLKRDGFGGQKEHFPKKVWVSCICDKAEVREIVEYQKQYGLGYADEYKQVSDWLESFGDEFEYDFFLCKVGEMRSCKLACSVGRFINPFLLRMKKYRKGKDWKVI